MPDDDVPPAEPSLTAGLPTPLPAEFIPPAQTTPTQRDNAITIEWGDYSYSGYLTTNWSDRITRISQLSWYAMKLLLNAIGRINFTVNLVINLPNPFDKPDWPGPKTVTSRGFQAIIELLELLHRKIDNLHEDLPNIVAVASVPQHWQLKKEADRPQGILLFGEWEEGDPKIGAPKWETCIPYFIQSRDTSYSNNFGYWKGERQGIVTLADNSKIIVYARDDDELDKVFNRVLVDVRPDMKEDLYIKKGEYHGPPFHTRYVRLRRIDYYSSGKLKGPMDSYLWFPASV